ncbi:MAG: protein kinase domain-containing protein [Nannocystales bacterium]
MCADTAATGRAGAALPGTPPHLRSLVLHKMFAAVVAPAAVGRYQLTRMLGRGAQGVVYAADDPELDREVAIKLLTAGPDYGPGWGDRLREEARTLAALDHPNIVTIYDFGLDEVSARPYVVMERIEGSNVRDWVSVQHPSPQAIVAAFVAAAEALAAAHAVGVVHRDFKPENILRTDDGRISVVDFGLALRASESDTPTSDPEQPAYAAPLGTPLFMAPEQHGGETPSPRSDQFALCASLYEMLTGVPPFFGNTVHALGAAKAAGTPPERRDLPKPLFRVIAQGLAPAPEDRHESLAALALQLATNGVPAPTAARRLIPGLAVLGMSLLAARLVVPDRSPDPRPIAAQAVAFPGDTDAKRPALPVDAETRGRIAAARQQLRASRSLEQEGHYDAALTLFATMDEAVDELGYGPLSAELDLSRATVLELTGRYPEAAVALEAAWEVGWASGHDLVAAEAAVHRAGLANGPGEAEIARRWARNARSAITRAGSDPELELLLEYTLATVEERAGEFGAAEKHYRAVLERCRDRPDKRHFVVAARNGLGNTARLSGDIGAAVPHYRAGLDAAILAFGEDHPKSLSLEVGLGAASMDNGDLLDAQRTITDALERVARLELQQTPIGAFANYTAGELALRHRQFDVARRSFGEALAFHRSDHGVQASEVEARYQLARLALANGDASTAVEWFTAAQESTASSEVSRAQRVLIDAGLVLALLEDEQPDAADLILGRLPSVLPVDMPPWSRGVVEWARGRALLALGRDPSESLREAARLLDAAGTEAEPDLTAWHTWAATADSP